MPETALYDIYEHDVRSPHERQHRSQTRRWPGRQYSYRHRSGLTATAKLTPREKKWIIYDVGNSAFVLLSTAVIPIYAKSLMPADGNIVSAWGYAQTIASLVIALLMPLLGSIADVQGMKIKFFLGFFGTGVVTCCAMALP